MSRLTGCAGKSRMASRRQALAAMRRLARHRLKGEYFEMYRCKFCASWHVGGRMKRGW